MSTIEILPNTFYVKQPFERDGFLSAIYTDRTLRDGIVSGSIENKLNSDRYIFNVKTPQTPKFGAYGVPQQQYLFLNTQELVINDNYATPVYKVYRRRNSFTLATGSYSDADSDLAIYTTQVNYNGSIMTETFDGINKGFGQDVETQPQFVISQESEDNGQYILYSDVKASPGVDFVPPVAFTGGGGGSFATSVLPLKPKSSPSKTPKSFPALRAKEDLKGIDQASLSPVIKKFTLVAPSPTAFPVPP